LILKNRTIITLTADIANGLLW